MAGLLTNPTTLQASGRREERWIGSPLAVGGQHLTPGSLTRHGSYLSEAIEVAYEYMSFAGPGLPLRGRRGARAHTCEREREREIYFTSAGHMCAKPLCGKGRPGCLRQGYRLWRCAWRCRTVVPSGFAPFRRAGSGAGQASGSECIHDRGHERKTPIHHGKTPKTP